MKLTRSSLFQVSLRNLLFAVITVLSVLLLLTAGIMAFDAWREREVSDQIVEDNIITDGMLSAGRFLIQERDSTAAALLTIDRKDLAGQFDLAAIRANFHAAWTEQVLPALLWRADLFERKNLLEETRAAIDLVFQLRARVDAALSKPVGDRDRALVRSWNAAATEAVEKAEALRIAAARHANRKDAETGRYSALKDLLWTMQDYAGREVSIISKYIRLELPLPPRELRVLFHNRGKVDLAWRALVEAAAGDDTDPAVKAAVDSIQIAFGEKFGAIRKTVYNEGIGARDYSITVETWLQSVQAGIGSLTALEASLIAANERHTQSKAESAFRVLTLLSILLILGVATSIGSILIISRRIIRPLVRMTAVTGRLAAGDMAVAIPGGDRSDEIGDMARSLEQIRTVGVESARAKASLDDASAPIMLVDPKGVVIFANKAMQQLYAHLSKTLAAELPGFNSEQIVGQKFDGLHDIEPLKVVNLAALDQSRHAPLEKAGHTIDLQAGPVLNDQGDRLGTVVEWRDRTQEAAIEMEVASIVHAASVGDFGQRLETDGKDGFMLELTKGMNELIVTVDRGLTETVQIMSALANGDLTARMSGDYQGSFLRLKEDANAMGDQIATIARRISGVTGAVQHATQEIAAGVSDLSSRTEHQASSLEETTASMEELSATVRQNAENAQEANQAAAAGRDSAVAGGEIAEKAVNAMSKIEESSRKITEIVGLIQEIAFQTNLLALNAAVEAARAGDAGKGFAVVANEVRALAQRSSQASKDIKTLIVDSDDRVREGAEMVKNAGGSLEEIVASVKKVADFVSEIAAASQEQASGIEQVSNSVTNMDEITQQNAALVEETTAALHSAQSQVDDLREVVTFFKTGDEKPEEAPVSPASAEAEEKYPFDRQQEVLSQMVVAASGGGAASAAALLPDSDEDWKEY